MISIGLAFSFDALAGAGGCGIALSGDLYTSLHRAMQGDYDVQILTGVVNGSPRMVVLVGETHIKNSENAELGRAIVNNSDYIGFEGSNRYARWGGRFKKRVISPLKNLVGFSDKPQFWLAQMISKITGKNLTEGSTIHEALESELREKAKQIFAEMSPQERAGFLAAIPKVPENERDEAKISIGKMALFTISELTQFISGQDENIEIERNGPINTFHLEKDHVPDFWENVYSISSHISIGILAAYYSATSFLSLSDAAELGLAAGVVSWPLYIKSGEILKKRNMTKPWFQRVFPINLGLLRARNATMVRNINETFEGNNQVQQLVVIVGRNHIPEMVQLLNTDGFESQPLASPEEMADTDEASGF